ncbi:MAG: AMP-binding protein, partial [Pseudomonadota bacterium]
MADGENRPWSVLYQDEAVAVDSIERSPTVSIESILADGVKTDGDQPLVTTILPNGSEKTLSYKEMAAASYAFARYLREELKLKAGDVVALQLPNCTSYAIAMLGIVRAGLIVSNVNPLYTPFETRRQLDDCKAKALVFIDLFGDKIDEAVSGLNDLKLIKVSITDFFPPLRAAMLNFVLKYVRRMVPNVSTPHTAFTDIVKIDITNGLKTLQYTNEQSADDTNFLQYSGGTTGKSKGVKLSLAGIVHNHMQARSLAPDEFKKKNLTTILVLPLYHMSGFTVLMAGLLMHGHVVLVPSPRPLSNLKQAFSKYTVNGFLGVNTLFAGLMKEDWFVTNPPKIGLTFSGATALNSSVAAEWEGLTGSKIYETYGMTEATAVATWNAPGENARSGSVGFPVPGTTVRILKDDSTWAQTGETGEIVVKGPQVMNGYFNAEDLNKNAFFDGWLRTGDIGYLDA